ncbi:Chaperonin CPN60-2, mitochondrial [Sesbania bispinosa]|nr:Chaperonin CPN60-2, mitochondrial [Sesbania bispinosa]
MLTLGFRASLELDKLGLLGVAANRWNWSRNYAAKDIRFGVEALMLKGIVELADAVKVTMGPKVRVEVATMENTTNNTKSSFITHQGWLPLTAERN